MNPPRLPPPLAPDAHKGDAGRLLVVAGSRAMPGAAVLAVRAALRAGAGLVSLHVPDGALDQVLPIAAPEAVLATGLDLADRAELAARGDRVRLVGPGLGAGALARAAVERIAACSGNLVLDADGLNAFAGRAERLARVDGELVLTPHPGEAARLLGRAVPRDPAGRRAAAAELAERTRSVVVLKGAGTVVADGRRGFEPYTNNTGNPGMATAGSGDVLAGIAAAYLLALGPSYGAFEAACAAVYVHGAAGDLAAERHSRRGLVASDLIEALGPVQRALELGGSRP